MADEDKESKTEEATEKKVRDEMERGHVPVSREVSLLFSFTALLLITSFVLRNNTVALVTALQGFFDQIGGMKLNDGFDATAIVGVLVMPVATFAIPVFIIICVSGIIASLIQNPFQVTLQRIIPDFAKLSPISGMSRMFGSQGRVEFLKSLFKFLTVGFVVVLMLRSQRDNIVTAMFLEPEAIPDMILGFTLRILAAISIAMTVLTAADWFWTRFHWRTQLRMSKQDIKDEVKQQEGDPLVKSRLRSIALDRSRKRMIAAVPRATLVVANPTHYAIALRYVREEGGAPVVLAKGQDLIALKIREIAEQNDVPVIEDKALARSMFKSVEVDQPIPPVFYKAVAELIHFLYAQDKRRRAG